MKIDYTFYLDKKLNVIIDRPIHSQHPRFKNTIYTVNYGFVPETKAEDDMCIDAYVIGIKEILTEFTGVCIGLVERKNDIESKLLVANEGTSYTLKTIKESINFQEKYFDSNIIVLPKYKLDKPN